MRLALVICCFLPLTLSAQRKDSVAIVQLLIRDYKTQETFDIQAHLENCTNDYLLIEDGAILDMKKDIAFYSMNRQRVMERKNYFNFRRIRVIDDMAYLVYHLRSEISESGTQQVLEWNASAVFRKEKGVWKISLLHTTAIGKR